MFVPAGKQVRAVIPTKEQINLLPPFGLLGSERITLVSTAAAAERMCVELASVDFCGFDTESKALFKKGEASDGPHLIQLATLERAWVIQLYDFDCRSIILQWLRSGHVIKAGFGMRDDCRKIELRYGVKIERTFELNTEFRRRGFSQHLRAKTAVAVLFNQQVAKSKNTAKSDWSKRFLSQGQLLYAANDAYVAAVVYNELFHAVDMEALGARPMGTF